MNRREELQERYEDALFALLMDDIATAQGKEAEEENERLKNDPTFEIPEDVDKRCLRTIRRRLGKQTAHEAGRITGKVLKNVLLAAGIAALLFTGAFAASETVRISTMNLIVEVFETNTTFRFESQADGALPEIRAGWLPEGYALVSSGYDKVGRWYQYEKSENETLQIDYILTQGTVLSVDTEGADVSYIDIQGTQAMLIKKMNNDFQLVWSFNANSACITMSSFGMSLDDFLHVANSLSY